MLKEGILWNRVLDHGAGRVINEPTFLGVIVGAVLAFAGIYAILFLVSFL